MENRGTELVSLADELNFIKSYANLHQIRHGSNLNIEIIVDDLSGNIIPLSLQILLENCFKHNVISEENPLTVKVWRDNSSIYVENNLQKRKTIHESGGIGLETISKQYEYFSDRKIEIVQTSDLYTVKVPILSIII